MARDWLLFVGTYTHDTDSKGIYTYRFDEESGAVEATGEVAEVANPSFLALDPQYRCLYAVAEVSEYEGTPGGGALAYSIDPASGALTPIDHQSTVGPGPCHLVVEASGRYVLAANYGGGSVAMLPIREDGGLGPASDFVQHEGSSIDPGRQQEPHAHSIFNDPGNAHAYVPDLGMDKVLVYDLDLDTGRLVPGGHHGAVPPGSGPRHFDFHPNGRFAYAINELSNTVTVYDYDAGSGRIDAIETVSTLPGDFTGTSHTADVHVTASGRFLYGSNRGHDSLAMFAIDQESGRLEFLGTEPTQGSQPRNFAIDPTDRFVLAANHHGDNIVTFRIDQQSGRLDPTGASAYAPTPVCLKFMPV